MHTLPQIERIRRQVAARLIPQIADLLYKADKGSEHAQLMDLPEPWRVPYFAAAERVVADRTRRVQAVNITQAHAQALLDDENEALRLQAQRDRAEHARALYLRYPQPVQERDK